MRWASPRSIPSSASTPTARGVRPSPHALSRPYGARSNTTVPTPWRAARIAVAAPDGPAPITTRSTVFMNAADGNGDGNAIRPHAVGCKMIHPASLAIPPFLGQTTVVCPQDSLAWPACRRRPVAAFRLLNVRCRYAFVGGPCQERRCRRIPHRHLADRPLCFGP